jgi:hypothetical protein
LLRLAGDRRSDDRAGPLVENRVAQNKNRAEAALVIAILDDAIIITSGLTLYHTQFSFKEKISIHPVLVIEAARRRQL